MNQCGAPSPFNVCVTSSKGRVSLKQLSQTSFTARSAAVLSGHASFAITAVIARRRTQALENYDSPVNALD